MKRVGALAWPVLVACVLSACATLPRPATVPMPVLAMAGNHAPGSWAGGATVYASCPGRAPVLIVWLPGAFSPPQEFMEQGFVRLLRDSGVKADAVVADAHLGYFKNQSAVQRLREDVVAPARALGYQSVWLVGISLGGFGAFGYAAGPENTAPQHRVDGIVALAPYLGEPELLAQIHEQGGPGAWATQNPSPAQPARIESAEQGHDVLTRELWRWLAKPPQGSPPLYLGYGSSDRLAAGHRLLATALGPDRVAVTEGGHDWPAWRSLWRAWLAQSPLPRRCLP